MAARDTSSARLCSWSLLLSWSEPTRRRFRAFRSVTTARSRSAEGGPAWNSPDHLAEVHAIDWSGRAQIGGLVECKRVVSSVQIPTQQLPT